MDKDVNDLHLKLNDTMDCSKWKELMRGSCSDSNGDRGTVS